MRTFSKTTYINCDINDLFNFHLDLENLKKITPPNIKVELLSDNTTPKLNSKIKLKISKFFIPIIWEIEIKALEKPTLLVDVACKSPFAFWEHQHIFTQEEEKVKLEDKVEFKLPFGFIGSLFEPFVLYDLNKMFDFRHEITKNCLEKG